MHEVEFRPAGEDDVPVIVAMLADDPLGAGREAPEDLAPYLAAFAAIDADPNQLLAVAARGERVVGTVQLSYLPGLSRRGATRAQIEAVRVHPSERGGGLGTAMIRWAIEQARARGCPMVQLTSDVSRADARRFYERLGFLATHVGLKMPLEPADG